MLTPSVSKRDHLRGRIAAPMTLVQYGDYACPHCTEAYPIVRQLMDATEGRLRFVYRHYPTVSALSRRAAEAAEAVAASTIGAETGADGPEEEARRRKAFWQMHDLLSALGGNLSEDDLYGAAEATGLGPERLRAALEAGTYAERVDEDARSAEASGVEGTPTFFIGEERYDAHLRAEDVLEELELSGPRQSLIARAYMQRLESLLGRAGLF